MKDVSVPSSLVLDLGTATTRAGWSARGSPTSVFPTVVGRGRHPGAMRTLGLRDSYVGRGAQALRGILALGEPVREGVVENWDDLELLWDYVWQKELRAVNGGCLANGNGNGNNNEDDFRVLVSVCQHPFIHSRMACIYANKSPNVPYRSKQCLKLCIECILPLLILRKRQWQGKAWNQHE